MTITTFEIPSKINELTFERDSESKNARRITLWIGIRDEYSRYVPMSSHSDLVSLRHMLLVGGVSKFGAYPLEDNGCEVITVRHHGYELIITSQYKGDKNNSDIIKVVTNTSAIETLIKSLDIILENIEKDGELPID